MSGEMNRRNFLHLGAAAGAAALAPRWVFAQAAPPTDRLTQMRACGAATPIKTTKLYDNLWLLQGAGGNMAVQTGEDGIILIDSSFATAVPHIREAIAAVSTDAPHALINTHWHVDHADGNEGMHAAGFHDCPREDESAHVAAGGDEVDALLPACLSRQCPSRYHFRNLDAPQAQRRQHRSGPLRPRAYRHRHLHPLPQCRRAALGDIFFNDIYPFIDEGTGGSIGGTIDAAQKSLALAGDNTKIIPGHGPLGNKTDLKKYIDMLSAVRDNVAAIRKQAPANRKCSPRSPRLHSTPTGLHGGSPDMFVGIVYRTV